MHPVVCPNCLRRYRVPWSKIPKQGAWVTCPACAERFVIKLEDSSFLDFELPAAAAARRPAPRPASKRKGPRDYLYRPGEDVPGELLVAVLDPVTPKARRYWSLGLVAALLAVFVAEALILRSSWIGARDQPPEPAQPPPPIIYDETSLAADLRIIQRAVVPATRIDQTISHTGGESRVYKYAAAILAPDACNRITALTMRSGAPSMGVNLTAVCFDPRERPASIEIAWDGRYAQLHLAGQDRLKRISSLLHQPSPAAAAAAAAAAREGEALAAEAREADDESR
jgi:predicted Zn finger-like uncharacterized protein